MSSFGERLVEARNKKGLSQEKMASELGVSRQMVSRWELNTAVPRMSRIEKICELLDITANELINGKEAEVEEITENNPNNFKEPVANHYQSLKIKVFLKRTALILLKIAIVLIILYIAYAAYKFIVLKHVISKVSKYENLDNYYCKIISNDENEMASTKEIWYKDGIYKITDITNINETDVNTTIIVDLNNNCRYQIDEDNKTARKRNSILNYDDYSNGSYMYLFFPTEISKNYDYIATAFKLNKVFYYKKDNKYYLEINNSIIQLNKNTYLPIFSKTITRDKKTTNISFNEYDIQLDIVQDEDIQIPNDYVIQ